MTISDGKCCGNCDAFMPDPFNWDEKKRGGLMHILEAIVFGPPKLWCRKCETFKPLEDFIVGKWAENRCRSCRNEEERKRRAAKRRETNHER